MLQLLLNSMHDATLHSNTDVLNSLPDASIRMHQADLSVHLCYCAGRIMCAFE